jgi:hypothetical protein
VSQGKSGRRRSLACSKSRKHRGLSAGFDDMYAELVLGPSTRELIERGYLTSYRAFVSDPPDLSGIQKNAEGDIAIRAS